MKNFKKICLANKSFIVYRLTEKFVAKKYEHVLNIWNKFETKAMKDYHDLYLKCDVLFLVNMFENLEIIASKIMDYVQVII